MIKLVIVLTISSLVMAHIGQGDGSESDECVLDTQVEEDPGYQEPDTPRRSTRLAKSNPLIKDWSVSKILSFLYTHSISAPLGISHEELFQFFLANAQLGDSGADPATPSTASKKCTAKKKNRPSANGNNIHFPSEFLKCLGHV